jgi:hypothetical protein
MATASSAARRRCGAPVHPARLRLDGSLSRHRRHSSHPASFPSQVAQPQRDRVFNQHTDKDGATIFQHACRMGLEGIVSKRLSAPYRLGRSRDWLKSRQPGDDPGAGSGVETWPGLNLTVPHSRS